MKKIWKRFVSTILVFAMIFSAMPVDALATELVQQQVEQETVPEEEMETEEVEIEAEETKWSLENGHLIAELGPEGTGGWPEWLDENAELITSATVTGKSCVDLSYLFSSCVNLKTVDLSGLDTSETEFMNSMFESCESLTSLDVSMFDTAKVTNMDSMFAGCSSLTEIDVSGFDVSNVTVINNMFSGCNSLVSLDLSGFNLNNATTTSYMLGNSERLALINTPVNLHKMIELPDIEGYKWVDKDNNVRKSLPMNSSESITLTRVEGALSEMDIVESGTSGDLNWEISGTGELRISGSGDYELIENETGEYIPEWGEYGRLIKTANVNVTNITNMKAMFADCHFMTTINFNNIDTSKVTDMSYLFKDCGKLENLDLDSFDTAQVTNMSYMFDGCNTTDLEYEDQMMSLLDLSHFDTSNVTDMSYMFHSTYGIKAFDLSSFDTLNVTDMSYMFFASAAMKELDLSSFDMGSVNKAEDFLSECGCLETLHTPKNVATRIQLSAGEGKCWADIEGNVYEKLPENTSESITIFKKENEQIASGVINDTLTWTIDENGKFVLSGWESEPETDMYQSWAEYADQITSAEVSAVYLTSLNKLFEGCVNLKEANFTGAEPLAPENISRLFYGCTSLETVDLSNIDCSNIIEAGEVFENCTELKQIYTPTNLLYNINLPSFSLKQWDIQDGDKAGAYTTLPKDCTESYFLELTPYVHGVAGGWTWSINQEGTLTLSGIGNFDKTSMMKPWDSMKYGDKVKRAVISIDGMTDASYLLAGYSFLEEVDFSGCKNCNITDASYMFDGCSLLGSVDLSTLNMAGTVNAEGMFYRCSSLTELDLSTFDMNRVSNVDRFIENCTSLETIHAPLYLHYEIPLITGEDKEWRDAKGNIYQQIPQDLTESITLQHQEIKHIASGVSGDLNWWINRDGKFKLYGTGDYKLEENATAWAEYADQILTAEIEVNNITSLSHLFDGCTNLTEVEWNDIDTSAVTDMSYMFNNCSNMVPKAYLLDTSAVTNMDYMFANCQQLYSLELSTFDMKNVKSAEGMLYGLTSLEWIELPKNVAVSVKLPVEDGGAWVSEEGEVYVELPKGFSESFTITPIEVYGISGDLNWWINNDELFIKGSGDYELVDGTTAWSKYADRISRATVEVDNITSLKNLFAGLKYLYDCNLYGLDSSQVTDMSYMFSDCQYLSYCELSKLDTSQVTNVEAMFFNCKYLQSVENLAFDAGKVENASLMFALCENLQEVDVSNWNMQNLTNMGKMFNGCSSLKEIDMGNWNAAKLNSVTDIFSYCEQLEILDLSGLDFANSTDEYISGMLDGVTNLHTIYTPLNLSFEVSLPKKEGYVWVNSAALYESLPMNQTSSIELLLEKEVLKGKSGDLEWSLTGEGEFTLTGSGDYEIVNGKTAWSSYADKIISAEIAVNNVTNLSHLFDGCTNLKEVEWNNIDTSQVTNMQGMFFNCTNLQLVDVTDWEMGKVENTSRMFALCENLQSVDVSNWNMQNLTNMDKMFNGCNSLEIVDTSNWNATKLNSVTDIFTGCTGLKILNLSGLDLANNTDENISEMFTDATNLHTIYTPLNLAYEVSLPTIKGYQWRSYHAVHTILPLDLDESIEINRTKLIAEGARGNLTWTIDTGGRLTLTGSGEYGNGTESVPWLYYANSISTAYVNVDNMTDMSMLFAGHDKLQTVTFESDMSKVTDISYMFSGCTSLKELDWSNADFSNITNAEEVFSGCNALVRIQTPKMLSQFVELPLAAGYAWVNDSTIYESLPMNQTSSLELLLEKNVLKGKSGDLEWSLTDKGKFTLIGSGDYEVVNGETAWSPYADKIISAEINVDNITNLSYLFQRCYNLQSIDYSKSDFSKVMDVSYMFDGCSELSALNLSDFNMDKVTEAEYMLNNCNSLKSINGPTNLKIDIKLPLTSSYRWKSNGEWCFYLPKSSKSVPLVVSPILAGEVGESTNWHLDTDGRLYVNGGNCNYFPKGWLIEGVRENIKSASVKIENVSNVSEFFRNCENMTSVDFTGSDFSMTTNMKNMFENCSSLERLDLSGFNTRKVDSFPTFKNCKSLKYLDISSFEFVANWGLYLVEEGCDNLTQIKVPANVSVFIYIQKENGENLVKWTDGNEMYTTLPKNLPESVVLTKVIIPQPTWSLDEKGNLTVKGYTELPEWDSDNYNFPWLSSTYRNKIKKATVIAENVPDLGGLFKDCKYLTSVDFTGSDFTKTKNFSYMFHGCSSLKLVNWGDSPLKDAETMSYMFEDCTSLKSMSFTSGSIEKVKDITSMFGGCSNLEIVKLDNLNLSNLSEIRFLAYIFDECSSLEKIYTPKYMPVAVELPKKSGYKWINSGGIGQKYFPVNAEESIILTRVAGKLGANDEIASGKSGDLDWKITGNKELIISGTGDYELITNSNGEETPAWAAFAYDISSAQVKVSDTTSFKNLFKNCRMLKSVTFDGSDTSKVTDMSHMFEGCDYLAKVDTSDLDTSSVTTMAYMFADSANGETETEYFEYMEVLDLSGLDTSRVTDMSHMFEGMIHTFEIILFGIDTSQVTDMSYMFSRCVLLEDLDVRGFDTAKVTNMSHMFGGCAEVDQIDISGFDTSRVTNMAHMFRGCKKLESIDVSGFDTSQVTDMSNMFSGCNKVRELNLSTWNTDKLTQVNRMFSAMGLLKTLDLTDQNWGNVENGDSVFVSCEKLKEIMVPKNLNIEIALPVLGTAKSWRDTQNVIYNNLPQNCSVSSRLSVYTEYAILYEGVDGKLEWMIDSHGLLTISGEGDYTISGYSSTPWSAYGGYIESAKVEASNITSLKFMFNDLEELKQVDLSGLDTSKVTNMRGMFSGCLALEEVDFTGIDTNQVTDMSRMFENCQSLKYVDVSNFVTDNVTNMSGMFQDCRSLKQVDVSNFDISKVKDLCDMFQDCRSLEELDVSNFKNSVAYRAYSMFQRCYKIRYLDLSGLNLGNVPFIEDKDAAYLINGCQSLREFKTPYNLKKDIRIDDNEGITWVDETGKAYPVIPRGLDKSVHLKAAGIMYSGTSKDLDWSIDVNGHLVIGKVGQSGDYRFVNGNLEWTQYADEILSAEVNATGITSLEKMFAGCGNLASVDLSCLDASDVLSMKEMFKGCTSLKSLDMSMLDTSKVTDISSMFDSCENLESLDLRLLNMENVTETENIFNGCTSLEYIYSPIGLKEEIALPDVAPAVWVMNEEKVVTSLPAVGTGDIEIQKMDAFSEFRYSGTSGDIDWRITDEGQLVLEGVGNYQLDAAGYTPWFAYTDEISSAKVSVSEITDITKLFAGCTYLHTVDLSESDFTEVQTAEAVFEECESLNTILTPANVNISIELPLTDSILYEWTSGERVYTELPMNKTESLKLLRTERDDYIAQGISGDIEWAVTEDDELLLSGDGDFVAAAPMMLRFRARSSAVLPWATYAEQIKSATVTITNITNLEGMFKGFVNMTEVNLKGLDTSKAENMKDMFHNCSSLKTIDLREFDTKNVSNVQGMFAECENLVELNLSSFDLQNVKEEGATADLFTNCEKLEEIVMPKNVVVETVLPDAGIQKWNDGSGELEETYISNEDAGRVVLTKVKAEEETVAASEPEEEDLIWSISNEGHLIVEGTGTLGKVDGSYPWSSYAKHIISAKISGSEIEDINGLLQGFEKMEILDLSELDLAGVTVEEDFLADCKMLTSIQTPKNLRGKAVLNAEMQWSDTDENIYTDLPTGRNTSIQMNGIKFEDLTVEIESISLNKKEAELKCGDTMNLSVTYVPEDATETKAVTWSTSDASVVKVREGLVTAAGAGTAIITAQTAGGIQTTCKVTVTHYSEMIVDKKPTCAEEGVQHAGCSVCGYEAVETTLIPATGQHAYITVVDKDVTCGEDGIKHQECEECGFKKENILILATGKHNNEIIEVKEATCGAEGKKIFACQNCGNTKETKIPKLTTHNWIGGTVSVKASPTQDGVRKYSCEQCKIIREGIIPKVAGGKLSEELYTYNGSSKKPSVEVKDASGNILKKDTDYKLSYASGRKYTGKYSVKITYTGKYTGTETLYFVIQPKATTKVTANLTGYNDIKVSWNAVTGAKGYRVYYKEASASNDEYVLLKTTTSRSATKSNLSDGTEYTFKVVAYFKPSGNIEESTESKTANVWTLRQMEAPTVDRSSTSKTKVTISYDKIDGASGYQISKSTTRTGTYSIGTSTSASKTATVTTNKTYYYKVRAYKTVGSKKIYGPWSEAVPYYLKYVNEVTSLKATLADYNQVKLSWKASAEANGYKVYAKSGLSDYVEIGNTTNTYLETKTLTDGVKYTFKVEPYYKDDTLELVGSGKTVTATTLKAVEIVSVTRSSSKVKVKWKNISGESGYEICKMAEDGKETITTFKTSSGTSKTISATQGVPYGYKVRAYKTVGSKKIYGPWSEVIEYTR